MRIRQRNVIITQYIKLQGDCSVTAAETAVYYEDQGRHASQKTKLITLIQQLRPRTMSPTGLALSVINFRVGGHARLLVPFTLGRPWLMTLGLYRRSCLRSRLELKTLRYIRPCITRSTLGSWWRYSSNSVWERTCTSVFHS